MSIAVEYVSSISCRGTLTSPCATSYGYFSERLRSCRFAMLSTSPLTRPMSGRPLGLITMYSRLRVSCTLVCLVLCLTDIKSSTSFPKTDYTSLGLLHVLHIYLVSKLRELNLKPSGSCELILVYLHRFRVRLRGFSAKSIAIYLIGHRIQLRAWVEHLQPLHRGRDAWLASFPNHHPMDPRQARMTHVGAGSLSCWDTLSPDRWTCSSLKPAQGIIVIIRTSLSNLQTATWDRAHACTQYGSTEVRKLPKVKAVQDWDSWASRICRRV